MMIMKSLHHIVPAYNILMECRNILNEGEGGIITINKIPYIE